MRSLLLALFFLAADDAALRAGVFDPPRPAPEFSLRGSNGADLSLTQYRGKVVLLAFGFTSCTEVCPVTLATLAEARKKLGADAKEVQVVYVTVDPERDDPAHMKKYLAGFDPTFLGATGSEEQLAAVRKEFGITATRKVTPDGYSYSHSSYVYLIDRKGSLRALMPYGQPAADYAHDVRVLLQP